MAFIERLGGSPDLEAEFTDCIVNDLRGRSLDDWKNEYSSVGKFPDFACFDGMLLIEMKTFKSDQSGRINDVVDNTLATADRPAFYGERQSKVTDYDPDSSLGLDRKILNKLSKTIEDRMKAARKQFEEFRRNNPRDQTANILVILNSEIAEFYAEVVMYSVNRLNKVKNGKPRFGLIDAVIYISEKHVVNLINDTPSFVMQIQHMNGTFESCPWKKKAIDELSDKWAQRRAGVAFKNVRFHQTLDKGQVEVVFDTPDKMKLHELWLLEYRRKPYFRNRSDSEIELLFHRNMAFGASWGLIGDWSKPNDKDIEKNNRELTHINEEINFRGMDLRNFKMSSLSNAERDYVFAGLPEKLVEILSDA